MSNGSKRARRRESADDDGPAESMRLAQAAQPAMDLEDLGKAPVTLAVVLALGSVISAAGWFFISRIEDSLEKMREAQVSIDKALTSQGKDLNSLVDQFAKLSAPPPPVAQPTAKAP